MATESESNLRLEIGHVLFIDIVGYSKLLIDEQNNRLRQLNEIVLATAQVRETPKERLVRLPTGDGMALVFRNTSEEPVRCAREIAQALKQHPEIAVRMGIHSGPVSEVTDVNDRTNIAGAGINMAQRVMDCGDAGHILLSKRVAEDLEQYRQWSSCLHDLGECEVKHDVRIKLVNLYTDELGNPRMPEKMAKAQAVSALSDRKPGRLRPVLFFAFLVMLAGIATGFYFFSHRSSSNTPLKPAIPDKSIAVLPFENLSDDKANAYFADGIQDEILTRLANIAELKVISRTSTQRFKSSPDNMREIAQQLGVANILEGSVQRAAEQVRVNVQLIKAQTDTHLWAETYDRKLTDIFAVEGEIAKSVAEMLQATLTGSAKRLLASRPTENTEAHELYLQGVFYHARGTEADYRKAIDFYKEAVRLDPRYALAYTDLAIARNNLARKFLEGDEAQKTYAQARAEAESALALEPDLAAAHTARGLVLESMDFDWKGAETEYRRAIQLAPNDSSPKTALASLSAVLGHPDEAVPLAREELETDPLCASCYNWLSTYLSPLGRLDEAEQAIRKAIELQPEHADFYTQLTVIAIQRGDAKAALSAAQKEIEAGGWRDIALALAQQISGDSMAADAALKKLIDTQSNDAGYQIAQVYALRNDPDKVFEWLDRAWSNHDPGVSQLLYDPFLSRYQHDPRFAAFCRKVGLPTPAGVAAAPES